MPLLEDKEVKWRNELYYHYYEYPEFIWLNGIMVLELRNTN